MRSFSRQLSAFSGQPLTFRKDHTLIIKGIAILLMIWHHALIPEFYSHPEPCMYTWMNTHLYIGGKFCVALFTFIIGYGYAYSSDHSLRYAAKHICRLLKEYWTIFILLLLPLGTIFGGGDFQDIRTILLNAFGLQHQYNCANWYIHFYIFTMCILPLLSWCADRKPYMSLIASVIIACAITQFTPQTNYWLQALHQDIFYIPVLIIGYIAAKRNLMSHVPQLPAIMFLLIAILTIAARCIVGGVKGISSDILFAPLFIFALVALYNNLPENTILSKVLRRMGLLSTPMWFLHAIFFSDYTRLIFQKSELWVNNPYIAFILTTTASFMMAEIYTHLKNKLTADR